MCELSKNQNGGRWTTTCCLLGSGLKRYLWVVHWSCAYSWIELGCFRSSACYLTLWAWKIPCLIHGGNFFAGPLSVVWLSSFKNWWQLLGEEGVTIVVYGVANIAALISRMVVCCSKKGCVFCACFCNSHFDSCSLNFEGSLCAIARKWDFSTVQYYYCWFS
jgi:hypothetical protein